MKFHRRNQKSTSRRGSQRSFGGKLRRARTLETLEGRVLLAADAAAALAPWHNRFNSRDVNNDNRITPSDALYVINDLLNNGSRALPQIATPLAAGSSSGFRYVDVTGDNKVTPADALRVVNSLLTTKIMDVDVNILDMSDNPISSINVGQDFKIEVVVQDVRDPVSATPGVFSAFVDTLYDNGLVSIGAQVPDFGPDFSGVANQQIDVSTPGYVPGFLAISGLSPRPNNNAQQLFTIVAHASAAGAAIFSPAFDAATGHEVLLYPAVGPLTDVDIQFTGAQLQIIGAPTLSVSDVSQLEGNSGTTPFVFTVSLPSAAASPVTVQYQTQDGTATSGSDYTAVSGTITFAPGQTTQLVTVLVNGDSDVEPDETFSLVLSNPTGATLNDGVGLGTILTDDAMTTLSIADIAQAEGNSGTSNFVFTAKLSAAASSEIRVAYATSNGTATAVSDYVAQSGTLTFAPGETTKNITIQVVGDTTVEDNETFGLTLTKVSGPLTNSSATAVGTILNDEGIRAVVRLQVADSSGVPLPAGTSLNANDTFTLQAYVQDIGATPRGIFQAFVDATYNSSLVALDGPITFGPRFGNGQQGNTSTPGLLDEVGALGDLSAPAQPGAEALFFSVPFRVIGAGIATFGVDPADVTDHDILVYLDSPSVVPPTAVNYAGTQLLLGANTVSVSDANVLEGNSGQSAMVFTVSRFLPSNSSATVVYSTADGTAFSADNDYQPTSGTVTFAPGETTKLVTVLVNGDTRNEFDETFSLNLSNVTGATLLDGDGVGTITNDDPLPNVSISDASGSEGGNLTFTVSLSAASGKTVLVPFSTLGGSAGSGTDFTATSGTLTFSPGQTQATLSVAALSDGVLDPNETFQVVLGSVTNANVAQGTGTGTITDVPPVVNIAINSVSQAEGNAGTTNFVFTVTLSAPTTLPVVLSYATGGGSATANVDYTPLSGTLTFVPGVTTQLITVAVLGDTDIELAETFNVTLNRLSGPSNDNTIAGVGTIVNDDGAPLISVSDAVGIGLPDQNSNIVFTVSISVAPTTAVTVGWATQDNSANAPSDYIAGAGNLTFQPGGPTTQLVTVQIVGQPVPTEDESFFLNLSSSSPNGQISDGQGVGTIVRRGITVADVTHTEGDAGTTDFVFTLSLAVPSSNPVTVDYQTVDGTATVADNDYVAAAGKATFAANSTTTTVTVKVNGDTVKEGDETFRLQLSGASSAQIIDGDATATIQNDDGFDAGFRLQVRKSDGTVAQPGDAIDLGATFTLEVYVQDLHDIPQGIFQAFVDVAYNAQLAQTNGSIQFAPRFSNSQQGNIGTPGVLDEIGAFGDATPPANPGAEELFFSIPMKATAYGLLNFTGDPADLQDHDVLTYLSSTPVNPASLRFENTSINIGSNVIAVSDVSKAEGNSGTTDFVFTLTRFLSNGAQATVTYNTANGTATTADNDYIAASGTVTFAPGETTKQVTVKVKGDTKDENSETFQLAIQATGATAGVPGVATIENDDAPVVASVGSATASEGQNLVFTVSLSTVSGKTVLVPFHTSPGTATSDTDYQATSGTLTFAPGETQKTLSVATYSDIVTEPTETVLLTLDTPTNATVGTSPGTGSILDVPPASLSGYVYVDLNNNGVKEANESGLANVIVMAQSTSGYAKSVLTNADGSFLLEGLVPGTYTLSETQPGFFVDGRDTRNGVESATNDAFTNIVVGPSQQIGGFNFGERGLRAEFVTAFINRRALFASAIVTGEWGGQMGTLGTVNPKTGDVWISFDAGWIGQRTVDAYFATNQGNVTMTLYNNSMQQVATSFLSGSGHAQLIYNGTSTSPLFLKISGSNDQVSVQVTPPVQSLVFQASVAGGTQGGSLGQGLLASNSAATDPVVVAASSPDANDLVWVDDEDWLLD